MCPRKRRRATARMSVEALSPLEEPAPRERVLFWLYQFATYVTDHLLDDAAMLALVFS